MSDRDRSRSPERGGGDASSGPVDDQYDYDPSANDGPSNNQGGGGNDDDGGADQNGGAGGGEDDGIKLYVGNLDYGTYDKHSLRRPSLLLLLLLRVGLFVCCDSFLYPSISRNGASHSRPFQQSPPDVLSLSLRTPHVFVLLLLSSSSLFSHRRTTSP